MAELLTEDVWALILQHVPQADRLEHCALVCKKLSRAAAAATVTLVSLWGNSEEQLAEAFNSYLQHHGSHVTSLVLDRRSQPLTQLPCAKLLHLDIFLYWSVVQLGPHSGLPGVLGSATGLTSLRLSSCTVTPDGGGLSRLSVLVDLRHLQVEFVQQPSGDYATLPGSVLPSLAHLTRLDLSDVGFEDVHHVSSLTNLSVLRIRLVQGPQPLRLAPNIAPGFALPASLQQLVLGRGVVLDPAVLAASTQLTRVELVSVSIEGPGGGVSSGAALLVAVAGLQQLVTLDLQFVSVADWPPPCAAYAALTASSKLQKLVVRDCWWLPEGVWEHVFPPARSCPAMREFYSHQFKGAALDMHLSVWGPEAVRGLVGCCPGLQDLELAAVRAGPAVAALTALTGLTRAALSISHPPRLAAPRSIFNNTAGPGHPPDVWQQLQAYCLQQDAGRAGGTTGGAESSQAESDADDEWVYA